MRPEIAKADAALKRARQRVNQALREEAETVVPLAPCSFCGAPVGEPCRKGANPGAYPYTFTPERMAELTPGWISRGVDVPRFRKRPQPKTRPHAERRRDARRTSAQPPRTRQRR